MESKFPFVSRKSTEQDYPDVFVSYGLLAKDVFLAKRKKGKDTKDSKMIRNETEKGCQRAKSPNLMKMLDAWE